MFEILPQVFPSFFVLILGLIVGSFLNVVIYRLNTEGAPSPLVGRSFCPHCGKVLQAKDLIPLVSFFLLSGQCRYCQKSISRQYPLIELLSGFIFVGVYLVGGLTPTFVLQVIVWECLLVIFASDWIYGLIPDEITVLLFTAGVVSSWGNWDRLILGTFIGLVVANIFAILIVLSGGRAMGWGDIKLFVVMGTLLGWRGFLTSVWVAFVSGGGAALVLLLLHRKNIGATIALGPFLVIGTVITILYGQQLPSILPWLYSY